MDLSLADDSAALPSNSCWSLLNRVYFFCHSEGSVTGITWTAVTLYSGQLVAQSEFSVVITFAPDSGKWKVVYTTPGCMRSDTLARNTVSPERLWMPTQPPSTTPRSSASCGWISSRSCSCHCTFSVRRVCAPTLYCDSIRRVVSINGYLCVTFSSAATYLVMM